MSIVLIWGLIDNKIQQCCQKWGLSELILCAWMLSGILGTKEYRKPEWVTQMEELKDALKGNQSSSSLCDPVCLSTRPASMSPEQSEIELSADSLDTSDSRYQLDCVRTSRRFGGYFASSSWASVGDLSMGSDSVFLSSGSSCSGESHIIPRIPFRLNPLESEMQKLNAPFCPLNSQYESPESDTAQLLGQTSKSKNNEIALLGGIRLSHDLETTKECKSSGYYDSDQHLFNINSDTQNICSDT